MPQVGHDVARGLDALRRLVAEACCLAERPALAGGPTAVAPGVRGHRQPADDGRAPAARAAAAGTTTPTWPPPPRRTRPSAAG